MIRRSANFSLDSGIQAAMGWVFSVKNLVGEDCLVVPPVSFISRALHYLHGSKATATLVVPLWPSSYF